MNAARGLAAALALVLAAAAPAAQWSNDSPFNNGADVAFIYSDPSSGATSGAVPADVTGDLYWRAHRSSNFLNDVDAALGGSLMEIDGYLETVYDTDWNTTPHFYARTHTFAFAGDVPDLGPYAAGLDGVTVVLGPSGFGGPCTIAPSLCSPTSTGALCAPAGFIMGWVADIAFGPAVGSGIVIPAAGGAGDGMATTWFVTGGMTAVGGPCGVGDYVIQDVHSTDETQADIAGGINPSGGFQIAGGGLTNETVASMAVSHETWRGNVVNVKANTIAGLEVGDNGGGGMNGRRLSVGSGVATLGVELRDREGSGSLNAAVIAASFSPLPNPGLPILGGTLLIVPDALFNATSAVWQGAVAPAIFLPPLAEGAFTSIQLLIPPAVAGATLHIQGAVFSLVALTVDTTNKVTTFLAP